MFNSSKFSQTKFNRKSGEKGLIISANMHLLCEGACVVYRSGKARAELTLSYVSNCIRYRCFRSIKHIHLKGKASSYKELHQAGFGDMELLSFGKALTLFFLSCDGEFTLNSQSFIYAIKDFKAKGIFRLSASGKQIRILVSKAFADMHIKANAEIIRFFFVHSKSDMHLNSEGGPYKALECLELALEGINLMPGDELIIDAEKMTVTINGQNALRLMSSGSEFLKLLPGNNEVRFEGNGKADMFLIWKDRWL